MKKDPEAKAALREQRQREAAIQARQDYVRHKEANLARLAAFATRHNFVYYLLAFALFALAIAGLISGPLALLDKELFNLGIALIVMGGILLVLAILFAVLLSLKIRHAIRYLPVLSKEVDMLHYEDDHPDETEADKAIRLQRAKAYFQKLLDNEVIGKREYKQALKECGIPEDEPQQQEPKE